MARITLHINGQAVSAEAESRTPLADFLREHGDAKSINLGCEHGVCGACTVLMDGQTARSCIALAIDCDGVEITTLEGLDRDPVIETLRDCFHTEHGLQCGFCTPGMLVTGYDYISRKQNSSDDAIRHAFSANICRCTGYGGIVRAISKAERTIDVVNQATDSESSNESI